MDNVSIVRADFYKNGKIIPLGITYESGRNVIIKKIISENNIISSNQENMCNYKCLTDNGIINLTYRNNAWHLE